MSPPLWRTGDHRRREDRARLSAPTSLIVAPLAVSAQTVREAAKIGIDAHYVRCGLTCRRAAEVVRRRERRLAGTAVAA